MLKLIYLAFIPVITMRLWAEERRSGTVELLLTLPFSELELILGKYFSAWMFLRPSSLRRRWCCRCIAHLYVGSPLTSWC
jgi:ABC-type transport system involved in multi-copper enzyme maturation permease subunit